MTSQHQSPQPRAGRRTAARGGRVNLTTVLAVALPLLSAVGLLLVRAEPPASPPRPPTETPLTAATLICPSALPEAPEVSLTTVAEDVDGTVRVGLGDDATDARLRSGRVTTLDASGAVAVAGEGDAAPGLVAGRSGGSQPAGAACGPPEPAVRFTAVGAGPAHASVLELTNPDAGTAVADITVTGANGPVDAPRLRGVSVPGGSSVRLDLAAIVPRSDELAIEVVTARGRLGVTVLDGVDRIGSQELTRDWLPGQVEPATENVLLGLAPGPGRRTLAIANPGLSEVRAELKVVGAESVFAPKGVDEMRVPPQSVVRVPVTAVLSQAGDALGLVVSASGPVTAALRSLVRGDLSLAVPAPAFTDPATVLLPAAPGRGAQAATRRVLLADATGAGTVSVVARAADGSELSRREVEIAPGRGVAVKVPVAARLLTVSPSRTSVTGVVLTSAKSGASVLPLTVPLTSGLVPDVRPGLP